jgi:hypothetical protein
LAVFDNGDDRFFPTGQVLCTGQSSTCYSNVQIYDLDETAKTANLVFNVPVPFYSFFGGNAGLLSNGNVEFCASAESPTTLAGDVYELTQGGSAQTVWHLRVTGQWIYRGQRLPSLYPGVQW